MDTQKILKAYGLTGMDELVYTNLERIQSRYGKLFIGDKHIKDNASFNKCSEDEYKESIKHLRDKGIITKKKSKVPQANPLCGNYTVVPLNILEANINKQKSVQSPLPFDNTIDEIASAEPSEPINGITKMDKIDAACKEILKDTELYNECKSLKDYMTKVRELHKGFKKNKEVIEHICSRTGISETELNNIMTNMAYEINPMVDKATGNLTANAFDKVYTPKEVLEKSKIIDDKDRYEIHIIIGGNVTKPVAYFEKTNGEILTSQHDMKEDKYYIISTCYVFDNQGVRITDHREFYNLIMRLMYPGLKKRYELDDKNVSVEAGVYENKTCTLDKYTCKMQISEAMFMKLNPNFKKKTITDMWKEHIAG